MNAAEYRFVGGAANGKMIRLPAEYTVYKYAHRIRPLAFTLKEFEADMEEPLFEEQVYTKRAAWKGKYGRSRYFALESMSDDEAIGHYLAS